MKIGILKRRWRLHFPFLPSLNPISHPICSFHTIPFRTDPPSTFPSLSNPSQANFNHDQAPFISTVHHVHGRRILRAWHGDDQDQVGALDVDVLTADNQEMKRVTVWFFG
jgi:hypothetical protein